jgi:hypothetical protein
VRKLLAIAALAAFGVTTAAAQSAWTQELGIQGGFARVKPAGTGANDALTLFDVPGGSFLYSTLGAGALYVIVPWHNKLAVEAQFGGSEVNGGGGTAFTVARLGLRGDYALSPSFYAAAGGVINYAQGLSNDHMQLGVQAAVGYRRRLTGTINGRIEANFTATNKKVLGATDVYAVQVGISSSLGARGNTASRRANNRAWEPAIGISGGYASMHVVGTTGDISGVFFPGAGGDLLLLAPIATAPTMFVIIPMGQKLALEPGLDFHSVAQSGTSLKVINAAARLDYAVSGNWYAAAGGHLLNLSQSGGPSGTADGVDFALGYRFHLAGAFGGRFETNYSLTAKSTKLATPPINTLSLTFGAIMPLK